MRFKIRITFFFKKSTCNNITYQSLPTPEYQWIGIHTMAYIYMPILHMNCAYQRSVIVTRANDKSVLQWRTDAITKIFSSICVNDINKSGVTWVQTYRGITVLKIGPSRVQPCQKMSSSCYKYFYRYKLYRLCKHTPLPVIRPIPFSLLPT